MCPSGCIQTLSGLLLIQHGQLAPFHYLYNPLCIHFILDLVWYSPFNPGFYLESLHISNVLIQYTLDIPLHFPLFIQMKNIPIQTENRQRHKTYPIFLSLYVLMNLLSRYFLSNVPQNNAHSDSSLISCKSGSV